MAALLVDGSATPEAIPDMLAYRHFFNAIAKPRGTPGNSVLDDDRRRSYLQRYFSRGCGPTGKEDRTLSEAQIGKLLAHVDVLSPRLADTEKRMALLGPTAPASSVAQLKAQLEQLVRDATAGLPTAVDADAAAKIHRHVSEHVKARMKIYTTTIAMPTVAH